MQWNSISVSFCIYMLKNRTLMYFTLKIYYYVNWVYSTRVRYVFNKCWTYIDFVELVSNPFFVLMSILYVSNKCWSIQTKVSVIHCSRPLCVYGLLIQSNRLPIMSVKRVFWFLKDIPGLEAGVLVQKKKFKQKIINYWKL